MNLQGGDASSGIDRYSDQLACKVQSWKWPAGIFDADRRRPQTTNLLLTLRIAKPVRLTVQFETGRRYGGIVMITWHVCRFFVLFIGRHR